MTSKITYDLADAFFRLLFSLIFIGLGFEHVFADDVIQYIMPDWMGAKRVLSVLAGIVLLIGGASMLLGYKVQQGAILLGGFLIVVTLLVHVPALFSAPPQLPDAWYWLWDVFQRSNLVKNLCLLGVCIHMLHHKIGRYSLDAYLERERST